MNSFLKYPQTFRQKALLVGFLSIILILWTKSSPPIRTGDGFEYYYQNQSLFNHLSPELRTTDMLDMEHVMQKSLGPTHPNPNPYGGYYLARNGKRISSHFFAYSLAAIPAKWLLHLTGYQEMRSLELTNVACIIIVLIFALYFEDAIILFILTTLAGPLIWYIKWSHPECMIYCALLLSFMFYYRKQFLFAAGAAAIASLQQLFFASWVVILLIMHYTTLEEKKNFIDIRIILILLLAFASPIYYWLNFRTPSIIASHSAGLAMITPVRIYDYFFDLNFGLFVMLPGLLLSIVLITFAGSIRKIDLLPIGIVIGFSIWSATTYNWNSGMEMINRYSLLSIPPISYMIYRRIMEERFSNNRHYSLIGLSVTLNLGVFLFLTTHSYSNIEFGPFARIVLRHIPTLYNPDPETFIERAGNLDGANNHDVPFIYCEFPGVKILSCKNSSVTIDLSQYPVTYVDSIGIKNPRFPNEQFQYYDLKLDYWKLRQFIDSKCPSGKVVVVPWFPSFDIHKPAIRSFNVLTLVINRTDNYIGGNKIVLQFDRENQATSPSQAEYHHGLELPSIEPGGFRFIVLKITALNTKDINGMKPDLLDQSGDVLPPMDMILPPL